MLRVVEAGVLDLLGDAQQSSGLERAEERAHGGPDPREDDEDAGEGRREGARGLAAVEEARAVVLAVAVVGDAVVERRREETARDDAPRAARAVDGEGVDGVINTCAKFSR